MDLIKFSDDWRDLYPFVASMGAISRIKAALFLGLQRSEVTDCCNYLRYPAKTKLSVSMLFGLYVLYAYRHLDENATRRAVAAKLLSEARTRGNHYRRDCLVKKLNEIGYGIDYFLERLEKWLRGAGEPLRVAGEATPGLQRYFKRKQQKKEQAAIEGKHPRQRYKKLPIKAACKACHITQDTATRYLDALRDRVSVDMQLSDRGKSLTLHDFSCLLALTLAIAQFKESFKGYRIDDTIELIMDKKSIWHRFWMDYYMNPSTKAEYEKLLQDLNDQQRKLAKKA